MDDDPAGLRRCVGPGSVPATRRCPELPERAVQRPLYSVPGVWLAPPAGVGLRLRALGFRP